MHARASLCRYAAHSMCQQSLIALGTEGTQAFLMPWGLRTPFCQALLRCPQAISLPSRSTASLTLGTEGTQAFAMPWSNV